MCAQAFEHWQKIDVSTADVNGNHAVCRIEVPPVNIESLAREKVNGNGITREGVEYQSIKLLTLPVRELIFQEQASITLFDIDMGL